MGRITTIIFLLLTSVAYSQCNSNKIVVHYDSTGCRLVTMGDERFSMFFYAEKNYKEILDTIPALERKIKEQKEQNREIQSNLELQVQKTEEVSTILEISKEEAKAIAIDLEVENEYLYNELYKTKSNTKWYVLLGIALWETAKRTLN